MAELVALYQGRQVRLAAHRVQDGVYVLMTGLALTGLATAEIDGTKTTELEDGQEATLSVDANGRIWIAGKNLSDAVMSADDVVIVFAYDGSNLDTVTYTSAIWDALLSATIEVVETYAYDTGKLVSVTKTTTVTPA